VEEDGPSETELLEAEFEDLERGEAEKRGGA
jgi:hypothetical protein